MRDHFNSNFFVSWEISVLHTAKVCYFKHWTFIFSSEYTDWRPGLGALLQPVPFPENALADKEVQKTMMLCVMRNLALDSRCVVHKVLLPVREPRHGWIHIAAPSSKTCPDDGQLFGEMVKLQKSTYIYTPDKSDGQQ